MSFLRSLMNINIKISKFFDQKFLPRHYLIDGNQDFIHNMAPAYLKNGMRIYDIGGGKQPYVGVTKKEALKLEVIGLDISQRELDLAPVGAYDSTKCADIAQHSGIGDGDLVVCQAVLEHVKNTEGAMQSIASLLKPGGVALIFVPSRNAVFARLNILLPQKLKERILFSIYPSSRAAQGFPSFYHKCTPKDFIKLATLNGMELIESRYYFTSSYFSFIFPVYFCWRIWVIIFKSLAGKQAAETFSMALRKI